MGEVVGNEEKLPVIEGVNRIWLDEEKRVVLEEFVRGLNLRVDDRIEKTEALQYVQQNIELPEPYIGFSHLWKSVSRDKKFTTSLSIEGRNLLIRMYFILLALYLRAVKYSTQWSYC